MLMGRLLLVAGGLSVLGPVLMLTGCDPDPPFRVGLSSASDDGIAVYLSPCYDRTVYALYVTSDVETLNLGEVVANASWGFEASGLARELDIIRLGETPDGYTSSGSWTSDTPDVEEQVVVYFDADFGDADTAYFSELAGPEATDQMIVDGKPVNSDDFARCD
jgi:hypothetical protein